MTDYTTAIALFADIVRIAFPYAFVFAFGAKLVRSFMKMAFDGRVEF